jgi:hypothetical protein
LKIKPDPTPEEVAAIIAALAVMRKDREDPGEPDTLYRSRWRLAGLLGHAVPPGMELEGSLWSYSSWEGMT